MTKGDFGGMLNDPELLTTTARPYVDPEWGHRLDMYCQVEPKESGIVSRFLSGAKP
ncbi:hypothetical protein [Paraburkholderia phosphatilytica]|uniref:hypothetical protein n=1 Tax=Paraburkholderia phosphatilytica TaxID=2282883 RepID=UPI0013DEDD6D|nr:hypothetical protein [Paraburkholderia phosphatilytica]